jgi:hypothetical protein
MGPAIYIPSLIRTAGHANATLVLTNTTITCFAAACQRGNSTLSGGSTLTHVATADKMLSALLELQRQTVYSSTWCKGVLPPPATLMLTANISVTDVSSSITPGGEPVLSMSFTTSNTRPLALCQTCHSGTEVTVICGQNQFPFYTGPTCRWQGVCQPAVCHCRAT